jgi:hypothetical protein
MLPEKTIEKSTLEHPVEMKPGNPGFKESIAFI